MSKNMPVLKFFDIKLNKTQLVYKAGDKAKGVCHLALDGVLHLKNLDINLICEGCVDFKEK
jgi:hypothetical protein